MPSAETPNALDHGWRRLVRNWNEFWFTPRNPLLLATMRIATGLIFCYSLIVYSNSLNDFLGPDAWIDHQAAGEAVLNEPMQTGTLSGYNESPPCTPTTVEEQRYADRYFFRFKDVPPCPFPKSQQEADYCDEYRATYGFDLRKYGLPPPKNVQQWNWVKIYTETYQVAMPPPYPQSDLELKAIMDYIDRFDADPRRCYSRGYWVFSIWYHIRDPFWMGVTHALFLTAALMFTFGLATRVTSFVTWFAAISYIQRDTVVGYGVDTMMVILMLYLAIGPSGAMLSLDRLIARWWHGGNAPPPRASVLANFAIRLLQIHLCIIYAAAGFSKLQGTAWWNGLALWNVFGNFEFAPWNWELYEAMLRMLGSHQLVWESFLTGGAYFTLLFEIMYAIFIWRPNARWLVLSAAILLHGVIGVLMGLGTFALIMLIMNMAFLRDNEAAWIVRQFGVEPAPLAA